MKILFFVFGIALFINGSLTVFSRRYLEMMRRKFWYRTKMDAELFPGKYGYLFDKYGRGVVGIIAGLGLLLFALFAWK
jgi:hypothetical protein